MWFALGVLLKFVDECRFEYCSSTHFCLEEHLTDPSRRQHLHEIISFPSKSSWCVFLWSLPRSIESLFLKKSELRWNTSPPTKNEKVSHSIKKNNEKFSSLIKTTNINTEEIFSIHSTSFSCSEETLLVLILGQHQRRKEKGLEAKSDCSNTVLWFSIVMTQSISWHFRTSPQ